MKKTICPRCRGNGFIKVKESIENPVETIQQCPLCNSQGEFLMDELKPQKKYLLDTLLLRELNKIIKKLNDEGRKTIIIGDHGHDEVIAIAAQVDKPVIISNVEEAKALRKMKKAGVVSQSTQMLENVQEIMNVLMEKVFDLRFINTICFPTRRNHQQIKDLAINSDVMIIIGSYTSANSKRLTQLSLERNKRSFQVTSSDELDSAWFEDCETVGISAGASTPDETIEEVIQKIKEIGQVTEKEEIYE